MSTYKWMFTGLVGLNLILGGALYSRLAGDRTAFAQRGGGDVVAVAGHSGSYGVIYILNTRDGKMAAVGFQSAGNGVMNAMGRVDVQKDFEKAGK